MVDKPDVPRWKQLADSIVGNPLQTTREVADKWLAVLSGLVGLSTVVGLIQGRESLAQLSLPYQIALILLFFLTFCVAIASIYYASFASEGSLTVVPLDEENFTGWYSTALKRAIANLKLSRKLAALAIVLLVIMLLITWLAPGPDDTGMSMLVVQRSGTVVCGTAKKGLNGTISISQNGSNPIALTDVVSATIVSKCP